MSDTVDQNTTQTPQEEFGIGSDTNGKNVINFTGGFNKSELVAVKAHEIGKGEKFFVLDFQFVDTERIKKFTHREFIPKGKASTKKSAEENYADQKQWFNSRIKHIWEAYFKFPDDTGLGKGVISWGDLFQKIADQFNTSNNGNPIFFNKDGDKTLTIPVWLKNTYNDKGDIQFPLLPNFIEKITPENVNKPKELQQNKYDNFTAPVKASSTNVMGGDNSSNMSMGNPINTGNPNDMGF